MKSWSIALIVVLPFIGSGCGFAKNIRRNVIASPLFTLTDRSDHHRNEQLGREAFLKMAVSFPDQEFSCDYRRGFVDGYTDFVDFGGTGEPPPMPPEGYRLFGYMNPEGLAAMDEWSSGFRHGAATARASNMRDLITMPIHWGPVYPKLPKNHPRKTPPVEEKKVSPKAEPVPPKAEQAPPAADPMPMEPIRPQ